MPTKITLSDKELSLVTNADWILTKQTIIDAAYNIFAGMVPIIQSAVITGDTWLPGELKHSTPKISKGENYGKLPYVMLDYPRCFNGQDIFAFRTMFWWANFFSITLHVSGKYLDDVKKHLMKNRSLLNNDYFIGINETQWEHHFREDNFIPYSLLHENQSQDLFNRGFIKVALKYEVSRWNEMPALLKEGYEKFALLLG